MFTSIILVCKATACTVVFSNMFYETELYCQFSQVNAGAAYIMQTFPDADYVEFACHKWAGPQEGEPT